MFGLKWVKRMDYEQKLICHREHFHADDKPSVFCNEAITQVWNTRLRFLLINTSEFPKKHNADVPHRSMVTH